MSNEFRIEEGYEHFVSPKRKRMMSPNNCIKISKEQGSTHVQKHRDISIDDVNNAFSGEDLRRLATVNQNKNFTSDSPGTNWFIRKPNNICKVKELSSKFGSLKKGNLFSEQGENSTDEDCSGDDMLSNTRSSEGHNENVHIENNLTNKNLNRYAFSNRISPENKTQGSKGKCANNMSQDHTENDTGTESDFSGVAGRMSTLSVGKRATRSTRNTMTDCNTNFNRNGNTLFSSSFQAPGGRHRASPGSSPSEVSSVNSSLHMSPAVQGTSLLMMDDLLPAGEVPSSSQAFSNNPSLKSMYHSSELPSRSLRSRANRLISSAILNSNSSAAALHDSPAGVNNTYVNQYTNSNTNHSDTDVLYSASFPRSSDFTNHSNSSSNTSGDSLYNRHQALEFSGSGVHSGSRDSNNALEYDGDMDAAHHWDEDRLTNTRLPPRTPFAHKTHSAHHNVGAHPPGSASSAYALHSGGSCMPSIEETASDTCNSPIPATTPTRTLAAAHTTTPVRLSQQSAHSLHSIHTQHTMGDLGTPVTEVGSPAVLDNIYDYAEFDSPINSSGIYSPARSTASSSACLDENDDPELVMITMHGNSTANTNKYRRGNKNNTTTSTNSSNPKSRLFDDSYHADHHMHSHQHEPQDEQYHLFAQRFMTSPPPPNSSASDDRECSPVHKHVRTHANVHNSHNAHPHSAALSSLQDTNTSGDSTDMSLTRTHSNLSVNLTRTNSDLLMLSKTNTSTNSNSIQMDLQNTSHNSHGTSLSSMPLPDQSAFDAPAVELSRCSSYESHSVDPLFPTPGSVRKKRHVENVNNSGSRNKSSNGSSNNCCNVPPTPLKGLDWGVLGGASSPPKLSSTNHFAPHCVPHNTHHTSVLTASHPMAHRSSEAIHQLTTASSADSTPSQCGIAMRSSDTSSSTGSARSTSSHSSDILNHKHRRQGDANIDLAHREHAGNSRGNHADNMNDSFSSLSSRPALVRQSSLLDNKLLLSQSEETDKSHFVSFRGDFEEICLLGSGTFADVYKVRQLAPACGEPGANNAFFAIKKSKQQFKSKRDREWLLAEGRTMKLVGDHCPYVVPFVRAWQEDCFFYVQMGFCERGTVRELMLHLCGRKSNVGGGGGRLSNAAANHLSTPRNFTSDSVSSTPYGGGTPIINSSAAQNAVPAVPTLVPDNTIWHIAHDVTEGLHHIHDCGMVHLDIKPANLLITEQGVVQIGDFGMAVSIGSSEDGREGDTRYMAEELLNSARMPSADVFSLGLTLYEMACFCAEESTHSSSSSSAGIGNTTPVTHVVGTGPPPTAASTNAGTSIPLRITPRQGLPSHGPLWHSLRENHAPPIPAYRCSVLQQLLHAMMQRDATTRPSTAQILSLQLVHDTTNDVDPILLSAPKHSSSRPPFIARSASVNEIISRSAAAAGPATGLSLAVDGTGEIDYAALGDGAFTPNFGHSGNYSPH